MDDKEYKAMKEAFIDVAKEYPMEEVCVAFCTLGAQMAAVKGLTIEGFVMLLVEMTKEYDDVKATFPKFRAEMAAKKLIEEMQNATRQTD